MFPQRISLDLGLGWYRSNRQYVQGSGKLVLKLPGIRFTAPPHLHPFHGHRAFSSRGRCLATSATHTEEEKGHGRQGWVFSGNQRDLGHSKLEPCPACFSFLLGVQFSTSGCLPVRGSQDASSWGWQWVSWTPGNLRPCSRSVSCGQGPASLND